MWWLFAIVGVLGVTFLGINSAKKKKDAAKHNHPKPKAKRYAGKDKMERFRIKSKNGEPVNEFKKKGKLSATPKTPEEEKKVKTGSVPPITGVPAPKVDPVKVVKPKPITGVPAPKVEPVKVGVTPPVTGVPAPKVDPVKVETPKKGPQPTVTAAKKELAKLEKKVLYGVDVKKPSEVVARKISKMPNIDVSDLSKTDRKDHHYRVTSAVMKKWNAEKTKVHTTITELADSLDKGESPQEVLAKKPEAPSFKTFVEGSDKLITVTSEKYDYYHFFILDKSREVLKLLGPIDPRRNEIENIVKRVEEKIDHFDSSLDDFLVFIETDLVKMENIEKEIKNIQKTESARKVKKDIERYKTNLLGGKSKDGKTIDSLIQNRMTNMEIEGKISLGNAANKEGILRVVRGEWDKKVAAATKKCDGLVAKLSEDKGSVEEVTKMIPTLSVESFVNSAECRSLIANTYQKMAAMQKYSELMKKEFAANLGLLKDEELKKFVHEQMDALSADVMDPKVTAEAFKQKSKGIVDSVLEKVMVTSNKILAAQKEKEKKQAGIPEGMTVTQSGIIIPKNNEPTPKKEIILPNSSKR